MRKSNAHTAWKGNLNAIVERVNLDVSVVFVGLDSFCFGLY